MRWMIVSWVVLAAGVVRAQEPPAAGAAGAWIVHTPLNEAIAGDAELSFDVRDAQLAGSIVVQTLAAGGGEPVSVAALRAEGGYRAELPARVVAPPGFSYFVIERLADGSERPVFASKSAPHPVRVTYLPEVEDELERLRARAGERSSVLLSAEGVDYGDRQLRGQTFHDRYYRLEAGYAYAFLSRVESIRLSLVRVRGEAALFGETLPAMALPTEPGIDYGRAEIALNATDWLRLRSSLLLGASQRGFEYGGGGAISLGDPRGVNLDLGAEGITTLGTTVWVRLGFPAHPRVPMGAAIEVSSFPLGEDAGVRLLYDVGYRFGAVTQLALRAGYQGRTSVRGGASVGTSFEYGF